MQTDREGERDRGGGGVAERDRDTQKEIERGTQKERGGGV